ncbi:unnamed protein product [Spirodela intermedia]|uniref:Wall-associated receptor kinase galacturonan-binding domain-containing protein n=1 Tax=Spirodela intermedia TaxID=51605 RepID=A0A7I8KX83_SPIIN|nr:unnamed protein product [Spirodela intermedia]
MPTLTAWSKLTELSLRLALSSFLLSSLAWAADLPPDDCLPRHCGNGVNVSYPFWLDGFQPSHCGFPSFKLTCRADFPVVRIFEDDYHVRNIFYRNQSFLVSNVGLSSSTCYVPRDNLSITATPFSIVPAQSSLFFLLDCEPNSQPPGYVPINCRNGSKGLSFVGRDQVNASACKSVISFPIVGLGDGGLEKYNDALDILKPLSFSL